MGCYTDSTSPRALASYATSSTSSNSPSWCQSTCLTAGYSLAGVEYGFQCFCANSITTSSSSGVSVAASDCSEVCPGNSSQTCGNGNRIYIYSYTTPSSTSTSSSSTSTTLATASTTSSSSSTQSTTTTTSAISTTTSSAAQTTSSAVTTGWVNLGCFTDTSSRLLASFEQDISGMTTSSCQSLCLGKGYSYAGTEYGECERFNFVSLYVSTNIHEQVPSATVPAQWRAARVPTNAP